MKSQKFQITTNKRVQFVDITHFVQQTVEKSGIKSGICVVYTPHTTSAITINENADRDVLRDLEFSLKRVCAKQTEYLHREGNSDSHFSSSLFGCSQTLIVEDARLLLGTWQSVFFCEFDGSRTRTVIVKTIEG